jgi:HSP20 family protein
MNSLSPWKRDGSRSVSRMRSDWDRLFDHVLDDVWSPGGQAGQGGGDWGVPLELTETADEIRVRAEVPGVDPKDLDISVTGDVLTLSGEKREERESKEGSSHYTERRYGSFRRTVQLGSPVDLERVEARHEHGVVTITLQKAETVRPRRIEIQAG